ncbi:MAG: hypothetical protein ACYDCK_09535 [Thermoplasmatota archaeon]
MNRTALVVALVAGLALAGCLNAPVPNSIPPKTGDGPAVGSPTPTPSATASPTPSPSPSPTPAPTGHPTGGMLIRPAEETNTSDGFTFFGNESASGFIPPASVNFTFVAVNGGAAAQRLSDPCGSGNPSLTLADENGTDVALRPEPRVACMVMSSLQPFASGARVFANWSWDGTVYHGENATKAPPGHYVLTATFHARRDNSTVDLAVDIPINVLDASARGTL